MKFSIVIGLIFIFFTHTQGITQQNVQKDSPADTTDTANGNGILIEIDKLIVDETISKAGHDFMEIFFSIWSWPQISNGSFIMVIEERPFRGISTTITITINDLVVFETFLQTRYDILEELAQLAAEQTFAYLINYESIIKQLEGDDMAGTGIY